VALESDGEDDEKIKRVDMRAPPTIKKTEKRKKEEEDKEDESKEIEKTEETEKKPEKKRAVSFNLSFLRLQHLHGMYFHDRPKAAANLFFFFVPWPFICSPWCHKR
jgi:hypothetical protein